MIKSFTAVYGAKEYFVTFLFKFLSDIQKQ